MLAQLFSDGWEVQKQIESGSLTASQDGFKVTVRTAIAQLEEATRLVSELGLFSSNEEFEEVATIDLKYLLLPALLGDLAMQSVMSEARLESLQQAKVYFTDFVQRCKAYSIIGEEDDMPAHPTVAGAAPPIQAQGRSLEQMAAARQRKIERYRARKALEKKQQELNAVLSSVVAGQDADEDIVRQHTVTLVNLWVCKAQDNLDSIEQEMELLHGFERLKQEEPPPTGKAGPLPAIGRGFKPFVITKDMLKGKVFGAGYPSLPAMTVEEFYQQRHKTERQQQQTLQQSGSRDSQEDNKDEESGESLRRAREFDEFKDEHRRGTGNRQGKG